MKRVKWLPARMNESVFCSHFQFQTKNPAARERERQDSYQEYRGVL